MKLGREEIERSLKMEEGKKVKNVILFLGDGMGISTITSARLVFGKITQQTHVSLTIEH